MFCIDHHGFTLPIAEEIFLKPVGHIDLKTQVIVTAFCPFPRGLSFCGPVHGWYGIRKDDSMTAIFKIKHDAFLVDWLPRFKTDVQKRDKKSARRYLPFVGEYTLKTARDLAQTTVIKKVELMNIASSKIDTSALDAALALF